jgi:predicted unusual protein kinase regulating ubiquinone biosynthesis (AarF/ABC1/UbiB family)
MYIYTGILHADPHGGNLLKGPGGKLAYIDFGLVASVPISVREALVCSVVHLVERNYRYICIYIYVYFVYVYIYIYTYTYIYT